MLVAYAFARRYPAQCARIDLYRAFDKDAEDNRAALQKDGRLKMPVLGMDGPQVSTWASLKRDA